MHLCFLPDSLHRANNLQDKKKNIWPRKKSEPHLLMLLVKILLCAEEIYVAQWKIWNEINLFRVSLRNTWKDLQVFLQKNKSQPLFKYFMPLNQSWKYPTEILLLFLRVIEKLFEGIQNSFKSDPYRAGKEETIHTVHAEKVSTLPPNKMIKVQKR